MKISSKEPKISPAALPHREPRFSYILLQFVQRSLWAIRMFFGPVIQGDVGKACAVSFLAVYTISVHGPPRVHWWDSTMIQQPQTMWLENLLLGSWGTESKMHSVCLFVCLFFSVCQICILDPDWFAAWWHVLCCLTVWWRTRLVGPVCFHSEQEEY